MATVLDRADLPTGTVTFMFTDVEGSTRVVQHVGDQRFGALLEEHRRLIARAIATAGGIEVGAEGDAVFAVFTDPVAAVNAALEIQRAAPNGAQGDEGPLRARIGIHTGNAVLGGNDYVGVDVHRASRIAGAGHGGQILLSEMTAGLVRDRIEGSDAIALLGRYRLSGFSDPAPLYELTSDRRFPELRVPRAESRLPTPLSEFVGRGREIATGLELLARHRLVTLTGPGGTGKTRLAVEIARRNEDGRADGAYFVSLASLHDVALVPRAILDELGLDTAGGVEPFDHLQRWLSARDVLLVLDNFEQLIEGAGLVSEMLLAAPRLSLIVTSRAPLRLAGERELPVPPLHIPHEGASLSEAAESDGVRLFLSRATAVRPDFEITEANVATVTSIVRALDGLPLAIELAASRVRSLTPELILDRMSNQILASRGADRPTRQQTIVNTIRWSYDLLAPELRLLFEGLSVFAGTFGLSEADQVCGEVTDVLDGVTDLVEQSLLRQVSETGQPRFRMLTVVREFAFAALTDRGVKSEFQDRHAQVFTELAERAEPELLASSRAEWLTVLSEEHDNLRAAFDYAVANRDSETAMRLVGALWRFWQMRGHVHEGLTRTETALGLDDGSDAISRARALTALSGLRYWKGDWQATLEPSEEALRIFSMSGSEADISEATYNVSFPLGYMGRIEEAKRLLHESLSVSQRIGRRIGVGRAYWALGNLAAYERDWETTVDQSMLAANELSEIDAPFDLGWAWFMVAHGNLMLSRTEAARGPMLNALDLFATVRDVSALALILGILAMWCLATDQREKAAFFSGASHRLEADSGVALAGVDVNQYPELNDFVEGFDEVTQAIHDEGYNAPLDEAVERARRILSA